MRYLGGKARISKPLVEFLNQNRNLSQVYAEPFLGAGSIFRKMQNPRMGCDLHEDLILFYKALQSGWRPPNILSEEKYQELKNKKPSPLRAFALFFCSFGGKWKGGYARDRQTDRNFVQEAHDDTCRLAEDVSDADIKNYMDYELFLEQLPENSLVYCDPPYSNTTKYNNQFDHNRFWDNMIYYSQFHTIFISEYKAPEDFQEVWSKERRCELNKSLRNEKLFTYKEIT